MRTKNEKNHAANDKDQGSEASNEKSNAEKDNQNGGEAGNENGHADNSDTKYAMMTTTTHLQQHRDANYVQKLRMALTTVTTAEKEQEEKQTRFTACCQRRLYKQENYDKDGPPRPTGLEVVEPEILTAAGDERRQRGTNLSMKCIRTKFHHASPPAWWMQRKRL